MTDRVPGAPGQYQMVIAQDQFTLLQKGQNAVVNIKRDDKPITEGTPYSKLTVLPDELAKKICPDVLDPTPADAFRGLLPLAGGTMVGAIDMGGYGISNVKVPTAAGDVVTKGYVDEQVAPVTETIRAETEARKKEVAVERARIDTLAAIPPSATQGNTELLDIRIDRNGVKHATAGEAVRAQANQLAEHMDVFRKQIARPLIWQVKNDSVLKEDTSITIGIHVGIMIRKEFAYVTPGTYTFDGTDRFLVLRDPTFAGANNVPLVIGRTSLQDGDIILAYRSAHLWTIWDVMLNERRSLENTQILSRPFESARRTPLGGYARISSSAPFDIDTERKKISFGTDTCIVYNGVFKKLSGNVVDISNALKGGHLYYDVKSNMVVDTRPSGEDYLYLGTIWINPYVIGINNDCGFTLNGLPYHPQQGRWAGKVINCLGDSITAGVGATKPYHQWLPQLCGFKTVNNYGLGGSSIARKVGSIPDWDTVTPFVDRYQQMSDDADLVLVFGGVNDWVTARELGKMGDTEDTTFYGALKVLIEGLQAKYTEKQICFITPMQTNYTKRPPSGGYTSGKNLKGKYLIEYVDAIKEMCGHYAIPVMDAYHTIFYALNEKEQSIFMPDHLHPNNRGHKEKMACKIGSFINEL